MKRLAEADTLNVLSLFSGIGGLDLGLQRAGMTICGQVEIDPWCRRVLAKHWPEVPRHDDVRTCAEWWGDRPSPDLICGGFPCQPVSSAGKRLAQDDERWLWPAMADTIRRLRPRFALMENVPGLLVRGMGDVLGDLAACGYDAEWDCIPASAVGAPHRRDRVWIVAYTDRHGREGQPAAERSREHDAVERCQLTRGHGSPRHLADATSPRPSHGSASSDWRPGTARRVEPERLGSYVADPPSRGTAAAQQPGRLRGAEPCGEDVADSAFAERRAAQPQGLASAGWRAPEPRERDSSGRPLGDWWAAEPGVGRVAHGIPRRVDRLRGLGNAVVPQVAQHVGEMIMEAARAMP